MNPVAAVDPWSAGIMAVGGVAQAAMQKTPAISGGSMSAAFDNSGFVVNTGSGSASSSKSQLPTAGQLAGMLNHPLILLAVLAGFVWYMEK